MKILPHNFLGSFEGSLLINPVVSVLLHAAEAACLRTATTLLGFEHIAWTESWVFSISDVLLNEVLHKLIILASSISLWDPLATCGNLCLGDHWVWVNVAMDCTCLLSTKCSC